MTATSAAPLVILTHVCHPAITEGFLPAARALGMAESRAAAAQAQQDPSQRQKPE